MNCALNESDLHCSTYGHTGFSFVFIWKLISSLEGTEKENVPSTRCVMDHWQVNYFPSRKGALVTKPCLQSKLQKWPLLSLEAEIVDIEDAALAKKHQRPMSEVCIQTLTLKRKLQIKSWPQLRLVLTTNLSCIPLPSPLISAGFDSR